ncbi:GNAT family N-acetyltransferase [Maribacter sp. HTCC2170]|uniref:GNAT family N-acetyltransferase n=1 Tax=Maribacter sp. (strain HTCC2170 / KCCM 42371) TaxID=313603 RepID=UPI00006B6EA6|nr:GNAT family N-acetyltransferase [Maribacter sp. HTCC2170]EAQ99647.1 YkkB [Maribacter sp. HTCC2170]
MNSRSYLLSNEESTRLHFRKIQPTDFELWLPFFQDPSSTEHWNEKTIAPDEACQLWFEKVFYRYKNNLGGMNALIDKKTENFIGQCGLLKQTVDEMEEIEIGYSLLPLFRNMGYATEAAQKCKSFAFENGLAKSLISIIHVENKASQQVALRNGMSIDKTTTYKNNPVHIFRVNNH